MQAFLIEITAQTPTQTSCRLISTAASQSTSATTKTSLTFQSRPCPCRSISVDKAHIDETRLVTRRSARDQIHLAWNYQCAYCGENLGRSPTLDHVVPKVFGGLTVRENLISCCFMCNSQKGHKHWVDWYRQQPFWTSNREWAIARWVSGEL